MHEKSIHSAFTYPTIYCSVTGTELSAGQYNSEQTWPPFSQGAYSLITGRDKESASTEYLVHARNCAGSFCTH